jgi:L-arabinose isomerase
MDNGDGVVDDANAMSKLSLADNDKLGSTDSDLLRAETGSFRDLYDLIQANTDGVINLDKDYTYSGEGDINYILINKPITINGNGHVLNGDNQKLIA